jgi:hypothetical protein
MAYERFILLPPDLKISFDTLAPIVSERFGGDQGLQVETVRDDGGFPGHIALRRRDWTLRIHLNADPYVLEESQGMVSACGQDRPDRDRIALYDRRIEIGADEDPGLDHLNDFMLLLETLERLDGAVLFDPHEGKLRGRGEFQ